MRRTRTRSNKPTATKKAKNYDALSCPYNQGIFSIAELALTLTQLLSICLQSVLILLYLILVFDCLDPLRDSPRKARAVLSSSTSDNGAGNQDIPTQSRMLLLLVPLDVCPSRVVR